MVNAGTGDKVEKDVPTKLKNISNIRQVEMGKTHAIIRDGNHNVYLTGTNNYGQLGVGTTDSTETFTLNKRINDVIRVSAGNTYTVFLRQDGFVWACGDYNHGASNKKSITKSKVPVLVGSDTSSLDSFEIVLMKSEVKSIMSNAKFKFNLIYLEQNDRSNFTYTSYNPEIATIDDDGDILGLREGTTWIKALDNDTGKEHVAIVRVINNTSEYTNHVAPNVVSGEKFAIGLKEDGTAWTWGYDDSGLATTQIPSNTNVLATYQAVDAGKNFAVAIREDGTAWSVGNNSSGQLGIGNNDTKERFVQIEGLTDIKQIAAGDSHVLAMDSYGIIYGWGNNKNGELGAEHVGANTTSPVVVTIPNERIIQIAAGKNQSAFVTTSGKVYGMGRILNGYVPNIDNAVKVEVGDSHLLILRTDGTVYRYYYGTLSKLGNISNAIDISVKGNVNMYQSVDEKAYTWGNNGKGQLGKGNTTSSGMPAQVKEHGTNVFRIGSGYQNTYITANSGFVYGAGNNTYGNLGNGTKNDKQSATYLLSKVHTLVGDRNFEVLPKENTLEVNEKENLDIKSNGFNVFTNKAKALNEYTWVAKDSNIVTVVTDGEIQAITPGVTQITVTDKVTKEQKEITRIVYDIDTDRIQSITADGKEASPNAMYSYLVEIPENGVEATVVIKTKNTEDKISIDGGNTWVTGTLTTQVDVTNRPATMPFIVQTPAGNNLDYTLTINILSNDNTLDNIKVDNIVDGIENELPVTQVSDDIYEVIVPNTLDTNKITVTSKHAKAKVSINDEPSALHEQSYNLTMEKPYIELPIVITSESGRNANYTLKVYREDYLTTLKEVIVNRQKANQVDAKNYEIIIADDIDISEVEAITNVANSKVRINTNTLKINKAKENINTSQDVTEVSIYVEGVNGLGETYTLTIKKARTQSKLQEVKVDGKIIPEVNKIYTAYVSSATQKSLVEITAKEESSYISFNGGAEEKHTITPTLVSIAQDEQIYKIIVKSEVKNSSSVGPEKEYEYTEYTLIIKRGDTETGIAQIFAQNENIKQYGKQGEDKTQYVIKVLDTYTSTDLTIETINPLGRIAIGTDDISSRTYQTGTNTKTTTLTNKETLVPVRVWSEDGDTYKDYNVTIIRCSDDVSINIEVDEYPSDPANSNISATLSTTEDNTYEVTLQNPVTLVEVLAGVASQTQVKIEDGSYVLAKDTKQVKLDSYLTEMQISVQSEYGTQKTYTLKITTLSDDASLNSITVDGIAATYNLVTEKWEVRVPNTLTKYDVTATANEEKASIEIESKTAQGTLQNQDVGKTGEETIVPVTVVAPNGIDKQTYELVITEQSGNNEIGTVKVNEEIILPDESGNYTANVKSTIENLEIYAQAVDSYAKVTIDNSTNNQNEMTVKRVMEQNPEVYDILVEAEDGSQITKTLTVNRLNGDNQVQEVMVDGNIVLPREEDGAYYYRIDRKEITQVSVTTNDANAKVSIAGGSYNLLTTTEDVSLLAEITQVEAIIQAEDGTPNTIKIIIEKKSEDNSLKELTSTDSAVKKITDLGEDTFEIEVDDRTSTFTIDATTTHEFASLKLGSEADTDYVVNKMTEKEIDLSTLTDNTFTIDVLAENGGTPRTYTVKIKKVFSKDISLLQTDGNEASGPNTNQADPNANPEYTSWANADDDLQIDIQPDNSLANVEVYNKEGNLVGSLAGSNKAQTLTINETMLEQTATYKIKVINPNDAEDYITYTLNITKKSTNNNLQTITVNGQTVPYNEETGQYEISLKQALNDAYELEVQAENEYATISFDGVTFSTNNTKKETYTILPETEKTVEFTIMSQNGDTNDYPKTVKIYVLDNNVNIDSITVTGNPSASAETANYDPQTKNYSVTLPNTDTKASINIILESSKSTVKTMIGETTYSQAGTLTIPSVDLPGVGRTVINLEIEAEDGTKETKTLTISQYSSNIELEQVKVNGKEATLRQDGNYEITIGDIPNLAEVYAKTKEQTSKVSINASDYKVAENTANIGTIAAGDKITIPIDVKAEDGTTTFRYWLYITVKSGNNSLQVVEVDHSGDHVEAKQIDSKTYRVFVPENTMQTDVRITPVNSKAIAKATIDGVDVAGNPLTFTQLLADEKTYVTFYVVSEAGDIKQYTLEIIKESSDNTIGHIYVNGTEIIKNDTTGRYYATVNEKDGNPTVKAVTNNEYAYVRIGVGQEYQYEATEKVTLGTTKITTVPITLRSQSGVASRVEYLDIEVIYTNSNVDTLVVDDKEVTNYNPLTKTYIAAVDSKREEHEIFVMSGNTYAALEIDDEGQPYTDMGNITVFTKFAEEQDEKNLTLTITNESGIAETYTIKLIRKSNNTALAELIVNDVTLTPEEDDPDIYRKDIKKLAEKAKVKVVTVDPYATVKIGDHTTVIGTQEVWIDLSLTEDVITIPVIVTATDGETITTYNIILTRQQETLIAGQVHTENVKDLHKATIKVYKTKDTNNPRTLIQEIETQDNGTFSIMITDIEEYDIEIVKEGYLTHTITNIMPKENETVNIAEVIELIAGNVVESSKEVEEGTTPITTNTEEIEIDDLVDLNDHYGIKVDYTSAVKDANAKYDFNGDGIIDKLDRDILKKNYSKKAETVKWVNPITKLSINDMDLSPKSLKTIVKEKSTTSTSGEVEAQNFIIPLNCKYVITSNYGYREGPITKTNEKHTGIDISGTHHAEVLATASGEVTFAGVQNGYGNCIEIKHIVNGETIYSFYAHLSKINVKAGQKVEQGTIIALEGGDPETDPNPGSSTGHHLHFEIRTKSGYGNDVDPTKYIKF